SILLRTSTEPSIYFYVGIGGYYTYNFTAKKEGIPLSFQNDIYHHEGGMQYTIGLCLYKITLGATFRYGLSPLLRHTSNIKNNTSCFQIGYTF
ncbi:MAG: hypothetical protein WC389_22830, partial [Lutibacter sp.]